jgi:tRNA uridine 5-carboxymethylaminomethyl modification enzyme
MVQPDEINPLLEKLGSAGIQEKQKIGKILLRPGIGLSDITNALPDVQQMTSNFSTDALEQAEIQTKYQVYIDKERELVAKMKLMEDLEIPEQFDYQRIISLGIEAREKLNKVKPKTLGQASRISGINPTDVQILMVYMGR